VNSNIYLVLKKSTFFLLSGTVNRMALGDFVTSEGPPPFFGNPSEVKKNNIHKNFLIIRLSSQRKWLFPSAL